MRRSMSSPTTSRLCAFLIADGVVPSRDGRGYVLRRIIRRAIRHGYKLGQKSRFFTRWWSHWPNRWATPIPNCSEKSRIDQQHTAGRRGTFRPHAGYRNGHPAGVSCKKPGTRSTGKRLSCLYDTYGFPLDLTQDIARENDLTVDEDRLQRRNGQAAGARPFFRQVCPAGPDFSEAIKMPARRRSFLATNTGK